MMMMMMTMMVMMAKENNLIAQDEETYLQQIASEYSLPGKSYSIRKGEKLPTFCTFSTLRISSNPHCSINVSIL